MKKINITVLTNNKRIPTIRFGYDDLSIKISNIRPSLKSIIFQKNRFLLRKDIKQELGITPFLINFFRKRWSLHSELKRLFLLRDNSAYKYIMPSSESNSIYGTQLSQEILLKFKFHTIRIISTNKFNLYLFILYLIAIISAYKNKNIKSIICINTTNIQFLKFLQCLFPNSHIYIRFHDCLKSQYVSYDDFNKVKKFASYNNIDIESYSLYDSITYGMLYYPNTVNINNLLYIKSTFKNSTDIYQNSVFFLGSVNKSRFLPLIRLAKLLSTNNLKINFYFSICNLSNAKSIIDEVNKELGYRGINIINHINYTDYLTHLIRNPIIIDFYRFFSNEGYSFRIPEAIVLNKKIITNREIIQKESFYDPHNILLIREDINKNIIIDDQALQIFLQHPSTTYSKENINLFDFNKYLSSHGIE